jgi:tetratricopeptide (TPR) repeat protein
MEEIHEEIRKGEKWAARLWSREAILLTALAALAVMFGITEVVVNFYNVKQGELARMWFQRGDQALMAGRPHQAIDDLRNALSHDPNNEEYQLRIAQALAAADRINEAETYLFDLWNRQPGSGEINLELAQLEARKGNIDAVRFYDNAIYGVWEKNTVQRRWDARLELFKYWFARGNTGQAQAQLLALAADTPEDDYQRHTQIGELQLKAGDPRQALDQFRLALRMNRRYGPALAGAGAAEVAIGEYQNAISYLESAVRLSPRNQKAAAQLKLARLVLASDPFQIGISERERVARTINAFRQAQSTLANCASKQGVAVAAKPPQNPFQKIWAQGQQLLPLVSKLRGNPQNGLQMMNFVFSAENLAATECGPLEGKDQALWLIGKKHRLTEASGRGGK